MQIPQTYVTHTQREVIPMIAAISIAMFIVMVGAILAGLGE